MAPSARYAPARSIEKSPTAFAANGARNSTPTCEASSRPAEALHPRPRRHTPHPARRPAAPARLIHNRAREQLPEKKVKPEREKKAKDLAEWPWRQFWRERSELRAACSGLTEALAIAQTGNVPAFAFVRLPITFSHTVVVFPTESKVLFSCLQSRSHEVWARLFAATMKDEARYIPNDCLRPSRFPILTPVLFWTKLGRSTINTELAL